MITPHAFHLILPAVYLLLHRRALAKRLRSRRSRHVIRIAHPHPVKSTEITPEAIYLDRRRFLGSAPARRPALAGCGPQEP